MTVFYTNNLYLKSVQLITLQKMKIATLAVSIMFLASFCAKAQTNFETQEPKQKLATMEKNISIYGEFGFGLGQTIIPASTQDILTIALGGAFKPVGALNTTTAFYYAPKKWKGLGLGTRFMLSGGSGAKGANGDDYFFNYYNLSVSAKYYALSRKFNEGLYIRGALGIGQLTTKRANDASKSFTHQFAIGNTLTANIGYSLPIGQKAISLEIHYETSSRSGTINTLGDKALKSSQIGGNIIYSF
jgi:hypothetical protein